MGFSAITRFLAMFFIYHLSVFCCLKKLMALLFGRQ